MYVAREVLPGAPVYFSSETHYSIAKVCPCVHVIEEPTLFLDALWLPYRRDHLPLERALQEAGPVKAVFGHADVVSMPWRDSRNPSPPSLRVGNSGSCTAAELF